MKLDLLAWRHIPRNAQPCHAHFIHHASGRWNRKGEYGALYCSLHPFGALLEFNKYLQVLGVLPSAMSPRDLVSVRIQADILDLRDPEWILAYPDWTENVLGDTDSCQATCREMADDAIALGASAIRVPSSIMPGTAAIDNVVLYPHTSPVNWALDDGPDRFSICHPNGSLSPEDWQSVLTKYPDLQLAGMEHWAAGVF